MENFQILNAKPYHVEGIVALFARERELDPGVVQRRVEAYPCFVIIKDSELIGYAVSASFAPDILELLNIYISEEYRQKGLGSRLLTAFEEEAKHKYAAIILVNSGLYENKNEKRSARTFYLRNKYELIKTTGDTNVFYKSLAEVRNEYY